MMFNRRIFTCMPCASSSLQRITRIIITLHAGALAILLRIGSFYRTTFQV